MKVLMFTNKLEMNDDMLGAVHDHVKKLAEKVDKLIIICLEKGNTQFPENVEIHSLGKEKKYSKLRLLLRAPKLFFRTVPRVDVIFCHMNPEYTLMIAPFAKLFGKPIVSWYGHPEVSFKLRLMNLLTNVIATSDKTGCLLPSKKVRYVGYGINTRQFRPLKQTNENVIIWLGRLSRIKKIELLVEAVNILVNKRNMKNIKVMICGGPWNNDTRLYQAELIDLIKKYGLEKNFNFTGFIPNVKAVDYYNMAKFAVSMVEAGGYGKTNLEAMSCGRPLITCSKAFDDVINKYRKDLFFKTDDVEDLAGKMESMLKKSDEEISKIGIYLRALMVEKFDSDAFLNNLIGIFKDLTGKNQVETSS